MTITNTQLITNPNTETILPDASSANASPTRSEQSHILMSANLTNRRIVHINKPFAALTDAGQTIKEKCPFYMYDETQNHTAHTTITYCDQDCNLIICDEFGGEEVLPGVNCPTNDVCPQYLCDMDA